MRRPSRSLLSANSLSSTSKNIVSINAAATSYPTGGSYWIASQRCVIFQEQTATIQHQEQHQSPSRAHNGGMQFCSQMGTVNNFGDVWFNPASLANILSMAEASKVCRMTMDTAVKSAMHVHQADGMLMTFQEYKSGLYFYDAADSSPNSSSKTKDTYLFLHTVAGNKASHTLSVKLKERIKQGIYTENAGIHLSKSSTKFCRTFFA